MSEGCNGGLIGEDIVIYRCQMVQQEVEYARIIGMSKDLVLLLLLLKEENLKEDDETNNQCCEVQRIVL